jgi:hypothetical protein
MAELYFPAISSFEAMPEEVPALGYFGSEIVGAEDTVQLHVAPSGVSIKGRYWRDGHFLRALVHVQAAGVAPKTITAQVDLRPIARALKRWHQRQHAAEGSARVGGWPDSFVKAVKSVGKSKLVSSVAQGVKSVVQSKVTGAVVGAAAVVFPPVGVPAAAAYATANTAISAIDKAKQVKNQAQKILSQGTPVQKAALAAQAPQIKQVLTQASTVKKKLREVAHRASRGDIAAKKTARIFSHVMEHRRRVAAHDQKLQGKNLMPGLLVTEYGKIVPGKWLLAAVAKSGLPLLQAAAAPVARALPAPAQVLAAPARALPTAALRAAPRALALARPIPRSIR